MRDQLNTMNKQLIEMKGRPYIGLEGIAVKDAPPKHTMDFTANVKNFGTIPGTECSINWTPTIDNVPMPVEKIPDKPLDMFPGGHALLPGHIANPTYDDVIAGTKIFEVLISVQYKGPTETYRYCERERFSPRYRTFLNLGPCP